MKSTSLSLCTLPVLTAVFLLLLPNLLVAQPLLRELTSPDPERFSFFGNSVAGMSDVDEDGLGDFLIGEPGRQRAFLISGATGSILLELTSPNGVPFPGLSSFGTSVSGVPDTDGDSVDDLLIAASGEGRVYLYSGTTGALLFELTSPNEEVGGQFGFSVAGVADADGDGRGDLLIGAPNENPDSSPEDSGRSYLFSGATGTLIFELFSPNEEIDGRFGQSVSGVQDVDDDKNGDFLIGSYQESPGNSPNNAGRAYLFSGSKGTLITHFMSPNEQEGGRFGGSVSDVPDVNGDGKHDLLIGAFTEDSPLGNADAGRSYLFSGADGALLSELTPPTEKGFGQFGFSVAGVPDTDGDGRGDLLIGARFADFSAGYAYLFSGATGTLLFELVSPNEEVNGQFGFSVAGIPDADKDGRGDLVIGAPQEDLSDKLEVAGRVYLFSGSPEPVSSEDAPTAGGPTLLSPHPNPASGSAEVIFHLPGPTPVRLAAYDVLGREVTVLVAGARAAGTHTVSFDASGLSGGAYLLRLEADGHVLTQRLTVVR